MTENDMIYFLNWLIEYCPDKTFTTGERLSTIRKEAKTALKEIEDARRKREEARREREGHRLIF